VRHLDTDKASLAIAEVIVSLGRALDIEVVAEGVESENDLNALTQLQCHQLQGFYLGRPVPGCQFVEWYKQHNPH
jgi:EAL domain-containing protein (putative c-di-GMP-specific phosphodiesterase class I)